MVRVINVMEALQHYAAVHHDQSFKLQVVGDQHNIENNGCYAIQDGKVQRIPHCTSISNSLTINQLAEFLFKDAPLEMPLMLL